MKKAFFQQFLGGINLKTKLINALISISNTEVTMTREQYDAYKKGYISLGDIKLFNSVNDELENIKRTNSDLYKKIILLTALLLSSIQSNIVFADTFDSINVLGNRIYSIVKVSFRWVCIICLTVEIGKNITRMGAGGPADILKSILKYILAFSTLYLVPEIFNLIAESF